MSPERVMRSRRVWVWGLPLWRKARDRFWFCYVSGVVVRSLARTGILRGSSSSPGLHHGLADLSPKVHPLPGRLGEQEAPGGSPLAGAGSRGAGAGLTASRAAPSSEGGRPWPLKACGRSAKERPGSVPTPCLCAPSQSAPEPPGPRCSRGSRAAAS